MTVRLPCALAVGGLDPGGGAGILADVRAFAAAGVFGCAAAAVMTVQSTRGLKRARAVDPREVTAQIEEVLAHQRVRAIKVGALGSAANVRAVARIVRRHAHVPVVVDTPMRPTRGRARLLDASAVAALRERLVPRATLVTVNADEAGALLGVRVRTESDARDAAVAIARSGARAVLVKGGHIEAECAIDLLAIGRTVVELRARRLRLESTHGTGCALASLVAGRLARHEGHVDDASIVGAVRWAKRVHHAALARAVDVGAGMRVLRLVGANQGTE